MSRYIDADAFIEDLYEHEFSNWCDKDEVSTLVNEAPSIDIVRCKECKHGTYYEEAEMYICNANDQDLYEAEHFCSYGEREGE